MNFSENYARLVVQAGRLLLERALVVRTWGNVSVRADTSSFCITPTGASYAMLDEEDVVRVCLKTLKATGRKNPSSELLIHAKIYRYFPKVSFILHTHQLWASLLSLLCHGQIGCVSVEEKWMHLFGKFLPSAAYADAGTEKIAQNLIDSILVCYKEGGYKLSSGRLTSTLQDIESGVALMAHHGVVIFAKDLEDAFVLAQELEDYARSFILKKLQILHIEDNLFFDKHVFDDIFPLDDLIADTKDVNNVDTNGDYVDEQVLGFVSSLKDFLSREMCCENTLGIKKDTRMFFVVCKKSPILSYLVSDEFNLEKNGKLLDVGQIKIDKNYVKRIGTYFDDVAQIAGSFSCVLDIERVSDNLINDLGSLLNDSSIFIIKGRGVVLLASSKEDAKNAIHLFEKNVCAFLFIRGR